MNLSKRVFILPILLLFFFKAFSQEKKEILPPTFTITLNMDNAFGFNPAVYGSMGLNEKLSFSFYSIFWTNPSYGTISDGSDLWLETGAGVSFTALGGALFINPSLGFTHGRLLSDSPRGAFMEGIVPNVAAFYEKNKLELELYMGYYKALQNKGDLSGDYLLYWILPGYRVSNSISLGIHYESFVLTQVNQGETGVWYRWLGAYINFDVSEQYSFRFSGGTNTVDNDIYAPDFYKLSVFIPLK